MNRGWQLEQTLPANLRVLEGTPHVLAICDFNSDDDLAALFAKHRDAIADGRLITFRTTDPRTFHMSVAKNLAHRLALRRQPDVLFNLDADNFITPETIAIVERVFGADPDVCLHNGDVHAMAGTCGRIALTSQRWQELGGYDESFLPMSWQDIDLLNRARAIGLHYQNVRAGVRPAVPNRFEDKLANVDLPAHVTAPTRTEAFNNMVRHNILASFARPIRLPMARQRRFTGTLSSGETIVL